MPMSRYEIRNEYSLADPELYRAADKDDPEALLEGVAMAGLVGVLRQLGDLAEFAAEIFHDLHEEVMATATRGHSLMARVQQLEADFPSIEKAFLSQTNHSSFFYNAGGDWHPNLRMGQNLITQEDLPRFIMDSYEECRGPPRLFLLDKFDVAGAGACLKRYTDPSFFKVEASSAGMMGTDIQREKKIRKAKKKGQRWRNGETPEVLPMSHAKLHQLFLEERVENGVTDPARRVKLKRKLNAFPFNLKNGKSYMEKILKTPSPEHKVIHEVSANPPTFNMPIDDSNESEHDSPEVGMISSYTENAGLRSIDPTMDGEEFMRKTSTFDLNEVFMDDRISEMQKSGPDLEVDALSSNLLKVMSEKDLSLDGDGKPEDTSNDYESDDVASEMENYVDAPSTMESEMDTESELRNRSDLPLLTIKRQESISDANEEQLQTHSSDSESVGNYTVSNNENNSTMKETSSFSSSESPSTLAKNCPSVNYDVAEVSPSMCHDSPENDIFDAAWSDRTGNSEDGITSQHLKPMVSVDAYSVTAETQNHIHIDEEQTFSPFLNNFTPSSIDPESAKGLGEGTLSGPESDEVHNNYCGDAANVMNMEEDRSNLASVPPYSPGSSDAAMQAGDDFPARVSLGDHVEEKTDDENLSITEDLPPASYVSSISCPNKDDSPSISAEAKNLHRSESDMEDLNLDKNTLSPCISDKEEGDDASVPSDVPALSESCNEIPNSSENLASHQNTENSVVTMSGEKEKQPVLNNIETNAYADAPIHLPYTLDTAPPKEGEPISNVLKSDQAEDSYSLEVSLKDGVIVNPTNDVLPAEDEANNNAFEADTKTEIEENLLNNMPENDDVGKADASIPVDSQTDSTKLVSSCSEECALDLPEADVKSHDTGDDIITAQGETQDIIPVVGNPESCELIDTQHEGISNDGSHLNAEDLESSGCIRENPNEHIGRADGETNQMTPCRDLTGEHVSDATSALYHVPFDELRVQSDEPESETGQLEDAGVMAHSVANKPGPLHGVCLQPNEMENEKDHLEADMVSAPGFAGSADSVNEDDVRPSLDGSMYSSRDEDKNEETIGSGPTEPTSTKTCLLENQDLAALIKEAGKEVVSLGSDSIQYDAVNHDNPSPGVPDAVPNSNLHFGVENGLGYNHTLTQPDVMQTSSAEHESNSQSGVMNHTEDHSSLLIHPHVERVGTQKIELICNRSDQGTLDKCSEPSAELKPVHSPDPEGSNNTPPKLLGLNLPVEAPLSEFPNQGNYVDVSQSSTVSSMFPPVSLFPETNGIHLDEMPPLPPLPPVQWRMGKFQHASSNDPQRGQMHHFLSSLLPTASDQSVSVSSSLLRFTAVPSKDSPSISAASNRLISAPLSSEVAASDHPVNPQNSIPVLIETQSTNSTRLLPVQQQDMLQHDHIPGEGTELQPIMASVSQGTTMDSTSATDAGSLDDAIHSQLQVSSEIIPIIEERDENSSSLEANVVMHEKTEEPPKAETEQHQQFKPSSENELSSPAAENGAPNGGPMAKLPRPRNPLIDAVAAHDKSRLRKVTERARPQTQKVDERDSLLEQIRTKSFNLKPAAATRPSIQAPQTNLKLAAILEKANAIRQAFAGSDDDDEDTWSDS